LKTEEVESKVMDQLKEVTDRLEAVQKEAREQFANLIKPVFSEYFEMFPYVKQIGWTQYTPHFNDGEACEFGVYDFYFSISDDEMEEADFEEEENWFDKYDIPEHPREHYEKLIAANPVNPEMESRLNEFKTPDYRGRLELSWDARKKLPDNLKEYDSIHRSYGDLNSWETMLKRHDRIVEAGADAAKLRLAWAGLTKIATLPEEVFETLGEGRVVVNRKGIEVEEYDHD